MIYEISEIFLTHTPLLIADLYSCMCEAETTSGRNHTVPQLNSASILLLDFSGILLLSNCYCHSKIEIQVQHILV